MNVGVRLLRNGTVINTRQTIAYFALDQLITIPVACCFLDSGPSTGSTTYTIQGKSNDTCTGRFLERAMVIQYAYR